MFLKFYLKNCQTSKNLCMEKLGVALIIENEIIIVLEDDQIIYFWLKTNMSKTNKIWQGRSNQCKLFMDSHHHKISFKLPYHQSHFFFDNFHHKRPLWYNQAITFSRWNCFTMFGRSYILWDVYLHSHSG